MLQEDRGSADSLEESGVGSTIVGGSWGYKQFCEFKHLVYYRLDLCNLIKIILIKLHWQMKQIMLLTSPLCIFNFFCF